MLNCIRGTCQLKKSTCEVTKEHTTFEKTSNYYLISDVFSCTSEFLCLYLPFSKVLYIKSFVFYLILLSDTVLFQR